MYIERDIEPNFNFNLIIEYFKPLK